MHSDPQALTWFRSEFVSLMLINELVPGFAPKPYLYDRLDGSGAFLVTEYIDLGGPRSLEVQRELGRRLARLHQPLQQDIVLSYNDPDEGPVQTVIESGKFGFPFPTYCGSTEQPNKWHDGDWATFWQEQRLAPMFERLKHDKELYELGQRLIEVTPSLLVTSDGPITPSLLHGDLCTYL
jgi:protein-ribulosamine 3-kinase